MVVDTSGSMGREDQARATAETHTILAHAVPGEAIAVYSADTATMGTRSWSCAPPAALPALRALRPTADIGALSLIARAAIRRLPWAVPAMGGGLASAPVLR